MAILCANTYARFGRRKRARDKRERRANNDVAGRGFVGNTPCNGKELAETLDRGAAKLRKRDSNLPVDNRTEWVYLSALSRRPTAAEFETARDMDVADLLWAVLMLPEFQLVR